MFFLIFKAIEIKDYNVEHNKKLEFEMTCTNYIFLAFSLNKIFLSARLIYIQKIENGRPRNNPLNIFASNTFAAASYFYCVHQLK